MARIGVGPETSMSRTVFMQDLDELTTYDGFGGIIDDSTTNECRQTFQALASPAAQTPTTRTSRRLQHTHQSLGSYRHDLLVAMRVVNSIEREVVQAEYEDWLIGENTRCEQLQNFIENNSTSSELSGEKGAKVRQWQDNYCGSCGMEVERVMGVGRA